MWGYKSLFFVTRVDINQNVASPAVYMYTYVTIAYDNSARDMGESIYHGISANDTA